MAAIITDLGHTELAKRLLELDSIWVGIGQTTEWTDPNNPPAPDPTAAEINEPIGYKKVSAKYLVKPDPNGTIDFAGEKYKALDITEFKTEKPNLFYFKFEIVGDELPLDSFRQIGIFFELTPATGYESYNVLLPDQVADIGYLLGIDNRTKIDRYADSKNVIEFMLQL